MTAHAAQLDPASVKAFALAGNARLTLVSKRTETRYTYRLRAAGNDPSLVFVSVLTGPENEADYVYAGTIRDGGRYAHGKAEKAKISRTAPSVVAFAWAWDHIIAGNVPATLEIWHEGRCGRCNRPLTVPESIASGIGPECGGKLLKEMRRQFIGEAA